MAEPEILAEFRRWPLGRLRRPPATSTSTTPPAASSSRGRRCRPAQDVDAPCARPPRRSRRWSETPPVVRARTMFAFKQQLEEHFEELARLVTTEHGKTLDESRGSVRRAIECVEVACGAPSMLMGYGLENISAGIDCAVMRQPIGVCAAIAPFNFPAMVPLWFLPFAVVCGNTFVLKPSEQVPLSQQAHVRAARRRATCRRASSTWSTAARRSSRRSAIIRASGRCRSSDRRRWRGSSTSAPRTPASACRRSAARRTSSSSCPTPISIARCRSSPSRSTAAPASAAWPAASWCRSGASHAEVRDRMVAAAEVAEASATGSNRASTWGR